MRASQWLLGGATAATIVAAIASGCGGSTNSNPPQDSGADVTNDVAHEAAPEAAPETGPEAAPEAAACVADADITKLNPPDAEIGDSAATQAGCYACIKNNCGAQLTACNADCACNTAVEGFLTCIYGGGTPISCAGPLAGAGSTAIVLGVCLGGSAVPGGSGPGCVKECGVTLPEGGLGDGGGDTGASETGSSDAGGQ